LANAIRVRNINAPRQPGERARLKVVAGPDYGSVYVLTGERAGVGRGEENDVVLSDLKASRKHAEVLLSQQGWAVRDNGSANGIKVNNHPSRLHVLKNGDTISLGETTLEFMSAEVGTQVLAAPPKPVEQVRAERAAYEAQKNRVRASVSSAAPKGLDPKILLLGAAAVAAYFYLNGDQGKPKITRVPEKERAREEVETRNLASFVPPANSVAGRTAETFFRAGYREFRERNYLRARVQFENVLQVIPGHPMATHYLESCDKSIHDEIRANLEQGKRSLSVGKLKAAKGHFEAVLRLLYRDGNSPDFAEAKEQLEKINKELGTIEGGPNGESAEGGSG